MPTQKQRDKNQQEIQEARQNHSRTEATQILSKECDVAIQHNSTVESYVGFSSKRQSNPKVKMLGLQYQQQE
jgi:hypothetical protein